MFKNMAIFTRILQYSAPLYTSSSSFQKIRGRGVKVKLVKNWWDFFGNFIILLGIDMKTWSFQKYQISNIFENSTKRRESFGSPYYHHHDDEQRHHHQQQQQNKIKDEQLLFLFPEQLIGQRKPIYNNDWSEKLKTEEMPSSSNFWKIQHCALHFRNKYL